MLVAVAVVATLLLFPNRQKQSIPVVAHNEMPQTVKQQLQETLNQSNNQSNLSIYYNIPKFRILGCYKPTTLKMNVVLEIRRG